MEVTLRYTSGAKEHRQAMKMGYEFSREERKGKETLSNKTTYDQAWPTDNGRNSLGACQKLAIVARMCWWETDVSIV